MSLLHDLISIVDLNIGLGILVLDVHPVPSLREHRVVLLPELPQLKAEAL